MTDAASLFLHAQQLYGAGRFGQAKAVCEQICAQGQADARVWCFLSVVNGQLGDYASAVNCARQSLSLAPDYTDACMNLGAALINLEKTDEAIAPLEKVLSINPAHEQGRILLGRAYLYSGRFDDALACYEQVLQQSPGDINILTCLADAYEYAHHLEEARKVIGSALEISPEHVEANIIAARLDTRTGKYVEAKERLKKIQASGLREHLQESVLYQLGLTCDRMSEYPEAFAAFSECNRIASRRYGNRFDPGRFFTRISRYKDATSQSTVEKWDDYAPDPGERRAPIFLVAFPRSGTTLTEQILSSHPNIVASNEALYINRLIEQLPSLCHGKAGDFPYGLGELDHNDIRLLRKTYWGYAESDCREAGVKRFLDKLPLNIVEVGFIHRIFPDALFIFACRDPRDVCLSAFFQRFRGNNAMAAFLDFETTARLYKETLALWFHYQRVFKLAVHESRYESLVVDPESYARKLIDFVGEVWDPTVLEYYRKDKKRNVLTPSYQDISQPTYTRSMERWRNYLDEIGPIKEALAPFVEHFGFPQD